MFLPPLLTGTRGRSAPPDTITFFSAFWSWRPWNKQRAARRPLRLTILRDRQEICSLDEKLTVGQSAGLWRGTKVRYKTGSILRQQLSLVNATEAERSEISCVGEKTV